MKKKKEGIFYVQIVKSQMLKLHRKALSNCVKLSLEIT